MSLIQETELGNGIVQLTVDRPKALNALNEEVLNELTQVTEKLAKREDLRVVILTGAGRAFVAGADIKAMLEMSPEGALDFSAKGHAAMSSVAKLPVPVIAALNGFALGGGLELALSADLIYASEKAKLGLPEVGLGLVPGFGGTQRLSRLVGPHVARELVFTGKMIDAQKAKEYGIVLEVFSPDDLLEEVIKIAKTIATKGPSAVRSAKKVMYAGIEQPLEDALLSEQRVFQQLFQSEEPRQGMQAHLERRDPEF
jgi:enoyl-CoA hydratase